MSLSDINYTERAKAAGLNVYCVAEADKEGNIRVEEVIPSNPSFNTYSIAKAYTVLAIGLCFDKGLITPEQSVYEILSRYIPQDVAEKWKAVQLHNVLQHRIGYGKGLLDIDVEDAASWPTTDYLKICLEAPLPHQPGEVYQYTDAAFYIASRIVSEVSGKTVNDLLRPVLFDVMGFSEFAADCCPQGHSMGATGFYLRTKDMIKLGILWLNEGEYAGHRIVSKEWCRLVKENNYEYKIQNASGKWFGKGGMRGQMLAVNPELGRAVAWNSYGGVPFDAMIKE